VHADKQLMTDGDLASGRTISQTGLAARFNMSRAAIREALFELEREGFVRRVRSGVRIVADITFEDMLDIIDVRERSRIDLQAALSTHNRRASQGTQRNGAPDRCS